MNTIKYTSAVSVDKGLIRNNNEDNFYFNGEYLNANERDNSNTFTSSPSNQMQIYGVFDGMGGEALGEEASLIAAQVMSKTHKKLTSGNGNFEKEVLASVQGANSKICQKIIESGEKRIGTTFSALVIENDKAKVFNVGDSRVYLLRDNELQQVSVDDTTAQRLVSMGVITPEEATTHKDRHKLTQHLGIFKDELLIEPHISKELEIKKDDKFLLCSDGLTDMLTDDEIFKILSKNKSCEELCEELVRAALKNGGKDNVTTIVVKAETSTGAKAALPKKYIIPIAVILVAIIAFGIYSFTGSDDGKNPKTTQNTNTSQNTDAQETSTIYFTNPVTEVKLGTENVFTVGEKPANPNSKTKFQFSSSDPSVIEIDAKSGYYKAVSVGHATIKAESGNLSCELEIEVYEPITDIATSNKISLKVGENKKIQFSVVPNTAGLNAVFTSDNEAVAKVADDGTVTANAAGTAKITISVRDYSETIEINVADNVSKNKETDNKPIDKPIENSGSETNKEPDNEPKDPQDDSSNQNPETESSDSNSTSDDSGKNQ